MGFLYQKNKKFLFFSIFLALHCIGYSPSGAKYWNESVHLNNSLENKFQGSNDLAILMGNLNPKDESRLFPISESKFYIAVEGKKSGTRWILNKTTSSDPKSLFRSKTTYTKIQSGSDPLYEVYRKQYARLGSASPSTTFQGIANLIQESPENTESQKLLCKAFTCSIKTNNNGKILTYEFSKKTEATYPAFYKKFSERMEKLNFQCLAIPDGKRNSAIQVANQGKKITIALPDKKFHRDWIQPKSIRFNLNFSVDSYGIHFQVQNLKYLLTYSMSGKGKSSVEILSGRFMGLPNHKIEGRFFYIIPQGLVNLFIPDNIDAYISRGLELITIGSDKKKGNRFVMKFYGTGDSAYYEFRSHAEVYRKKFSLFGEKKEEYEKGTGNARVFFSDLWLSMARDLSQPLK